MIRNPKPKPWLVNLEIIIVIFISVESSGPRGAFNDLFLTTSQARMQAEWKMWPHGSLTQGQLEPPSQHAS